MSNRAEKLVLTRRWQSTQHAVNTEQVLYGKGCFCRAGRISQAKRKTRTASFLLRRCECEWKKTK